MSEFPFSVESILEQCGGNAAVALEVLKELMNQVPADETEMQSGFDSNTLITTSKAAHRLKGTAGVLGADKLHALCAALEIAAKEERFDDAKKIFDELKTESKRCIDYVPIVQQKLQ
ncbi:MAG: Hpt domain-containing protein [Planctomycetaceae bacterium]|jgi:HPt (histidine-containing phosphotransfer) domain-containing protein|nr:Hpt domain-containing protein [Planctomycetaceae bacterium]